MLGKIGNSIVLSFCGLFLGAILGFFLYAAFHFIRYFPLFSFAVLIVVFLINLIKINKTSNRSKILGLTFSTLKAFIILSGLAGSGWLFVGESVEFDSFDMIVLAIIFIISVLGIAIILPIRLVWYETKFSQKFEQNISGAKVLLGISEKSKENSDGENLSNL